MAKYIIDIDAFKECLAFLEMGKVNGLPTAFIEDVRDFIDRFPKEPLDIPNLMIKGETE